LATKRASVQGDAAIGLERTFTPDHFRRRAEAFRTKADEFEHGDSRNALLKAARTYDDLARDAEKIPTLKEQEQA
jgi:hypothetical protein